MEFIDYFIYSFHMPLFFIISGMLYSYKTRINNIKEYTDFIKRKAKALLIPYFLFSWLQIIIKVIMSGSVNSKVSLINLITIVFKPIEQFWFLYDLLFIFILTAFIDLKIEKENIKFLIFSFLYALSFIMQDIWSLNGIFKFSIYFYLGRRFIKFKMFPPQYIWITGVTFLILNVLCYKINTLNIILNMVISIILAVIGSIFIIGLVNVVDNSLLDICGKYSMSIFLLHTIFGSGIRIVLLKLGINQFFIQTLLGLIFGVIIPIVTTIIFKRIILLFNKNKVTKSKCI